MKIIFYFNIIIIVVVIIIIIIIIIIMVMNHNWIEKEFPVKVLASVHSLDSVYLNYRFALAGL